MTEFIFNALAFLFFVECILLYEMDVLFLYLQWLVILIETKKMAEDSSKVKFKEDIISLHKTHVINKKPSLHPSLPPQSYNQARQHCAETLG